MIIIKCNKMITVNIWSILISITYFKYVTSANIECDFRNDNFDVITNQYTCDVQNNLMINSKNVEIQTVGGSHKFGKTSHDVSGLSINDKKILFMPVNLGQRFKNLFAIKVNQGRLKEISQNDLKSFEKLKYLNLDANDIESLDDDLFEFNLKLEIIWFEGNRIKNVGMSVFDNLIYLNDIDLNGNVCISKRMSNTRGMDDFLREVKKNCFDAHTELVKFKQKYKEESGQNLVDTSVKKVENVSGRQSNAQMMLLNKEIEIKELKNEVNNLKKLLKAKDKEAEENQSKINEKDKKIRSIASDKNETEFKLLNCQKSLKSDSEKQLKSQLIDLQVKYSQLLETNKTLSIENQNLTKTLNDTELRLNSIKMESAALDEKITEYKNLESQLKIRETDLNKFQMKVESTISALTEKKEGIKKFLDQKDQEIVRKDKEIKMLRKTNNQLHDQLKKIKSKSISSERIFKADVASRHEPNKTKELLENKKLKFPELEVKFNGSEINGPDGSKIKLGNLDGIFSCDVSVDLNISTPNEKILTIHGILPSGTYLSDIKGLSIVNKKTEYLPINLGEKFTNLLSLRVRDGKLKKIDQDDLKSTPKLRYVDFHSNGLEVIERDLFKYNPQLEYISFHANPIKSVGVNVFDNLKTLNNLDIDLTFCIQIKTVKSLKIADVVLKISEQCSNLVEEVEYYKWKIDMLINKNSKLRTEFNVIDASSVDILCEYANYDFTSTDELYSCIVKNDLKINSSDVKINEVKGSHKSGKSNDLVSGLVIDNKKTEYFPSNLDEKFKNLLALKIKYGRLKEIHQDDLKKFSKLRYLNLDENNIEALDDDLFEFNTELELIWFGKNKIKSIGRSTFDKLSQLSDLDLLGNICTKERISGAKVKPGISKIKLQCFKPDMELENLKQQYQILKTKNKKLVENVEKLKSENSNLTKDVESMTEHNFKLCYDLTAKLEEQTKKILEKDIAIEKLKNSNDDLKDQISKIQREKQEKLIINQQMEKKIKQLETQVNDCEDKVSKKVKEINQKSEESKENLKEIENLQNQNNNLENQLKGQNSKLQTLFAENSNLKQELERSIGTNQQLEAQIHIMSYKVNGTSNEKSKILKDLENTINEKNRLDKQLRSENIKSQNVERNLTELIRQCRDEIIQLRDQQSEIRLRSAFNQTNLTDIISNLKESAHKLEFKNIRLENSITNLEEKLKTEITKVQDLTDMNTRCNNQFQECKRNNSVTEKQLQGTRADYKKIQRDLKLEQNKNSQCDLKLKFTENNLETMHKNLSEKIGDLESNKMQLVLELQEVNTKLNKSKAQNENLQKNLSNCILARETTLKHLNQSEEVVQNLKALLKINEQNSTRIIQNLSNDIVTIKAELSKFKNKSSQLEKMITEKNKIINDLTNSKNKVSNDLKGLQNRYATLQFQSNQNITQLNRLNNQTKHELQESQNKNQKLTDQLNNKTELSQNLQTLNEQKTRDIQDLQETVSNLNIILEDARNYTKLLESNFSTTVDNITTINAKKIEEYQAKINNFTQVADQLRQDISDHEYKIISKESEILNIKNILTKKSAQIIVYESNIDTLNQEIKESIALRKNLNAQLKNKNTELEKIKNKNQVLNKEVKIVNSDFLKCENLPKYTWHNHPIMYASIPLMCILTIIDILASFRCFS
ncbi:uncharacterized protein MAL8P1.12-like [Chironomus tepperi]|uniref:uncharacterized protein MAL8P1.12-like n=1 Tax=Chironomus tepperi TaxID=113505 RepID=UPI00391F54BB